MSNDLFLGAPFNIAQYALLLTLMAHSTGKTPGKLHYHLGDAHIYLNHIEQVKEQVHRIPFKLPKLRIEGEAMEDLKDYKQENIILEDYVYHPALKGEVAV